MCDMDSYSSCSSEYDDEGRALERLLDAFGPSFSLEDIASAYCKAGRNVHLAGEILYGLQENNPPRAATHSSNGESSGSKFIGNNAETSSQLKKNYKVPELLLDNNAAETSNHLQKNLKGSKPRKVSVSIGTVSSVLGKGYNIRPTSSIMSDLCKATKPVKLELKEPLKDDTNVVPSDFLLRNGPMNDTNVEEFLFSMLGNGFHLGMDVIRDVLGSCGYDAKKSMNKLLDLSTTALDKSKDTLGDDIENHANKCFKVGSHSHSMDFGPSDEVMCTRNGAESSYLVKEKCDLSREVLESLFNVSDRPDDTPKKTRLVRAKRRRAVGTVVTKPPPEIDIDHSPAIVEPPDPIEIDEEEKYQVLRSAAKKNWDIMKAYYESAVDEFLKGNRTQASYLLEEGKFYNEKAREADEKSAREILEIRSVQVQNEAPLELHGHDLKEAIRLLKFHLTSLANIPSIQFLKVIVESNAEDITKGARKRLVMKLLENESIEWKEEDGKPGNIIIRVDKIDAERLSFAKK